MVTHLFPQLSRFHTFFSATGEFKQNDLAAHARPDYYIRSFARGAYVWRENDLLVFVIDKKTPVICPSQQAILQLETGLWRKFLACANKVLMEILIFLVRYVFSLVSFRNKFLQANFNVAED
jgi:hypothetical protein